MYKIVIKEFKTGKIIKESKAVSEFKAEKLEDAYNINLDHDLYYTDFVYED